MGFVIKYCEECGDRIPEADLHSGAAVDNERGTYCKNHRPAYQPSPGPSRRGTTSGRSPRSMPGGRSGRTSSISPEAPIRAASSQRTAAIRPTPGRRGATSGRRARVVPVETKSSSIAPLVIGVIGLCLAAAIGIVIVSGSNSTSRNDDTAQQNTDTPTNQPETENTPQDVVVPPAPQTPADRWREAVRVAEDDFLATDTSAADAAELADRKFREVQLLLVDVPEGVTQEDRDSVERLLDRWVNVAAGPALERAITESRQVEQTRGGEAAAQWMGEVINGRVPAIYPKEYLRHGSRPFQALVERVAELRAVLTEAFAAANGAVPMVNNEARDSLAEGDDMLQSGEYIDWFSVEIQRGESCGIRMTSTEVNAYIMLIMPDTKSKMSDDDDGGQGRDAAIEFKASQTGTHFIGCTSKRPGESGAYRLEFTRFRDGEPAGLIHIEPGVRSVQVPSRGQVQLRMELLRSERRDSLEFSLVGDEGDVDLFVRPSEPFRGWALSTKFKSTSRDSTESVYLVPPADGVLPTVFYILLVNCRVEATDVTLHVRLNQDPPPADSNFLHDEVLAPDRDASINLPKPGPRGYAVALLEIPPGVRSARIWIDTPDRSIAMMIGFGSRPRSGNEALASAAHGGGNRIELLLDPATAGSGGTLTPGRYYVVALHTVSGAVFSGTMRVEFER